MNASEIAAVMKSEVLAVYHADPGRPSLDASRVRVRVYGRDLTTVKVSVRLEARERRPGVVLKVPPAAS